MNLKNMKECDNSKICVSNNSLLSICLLIMLDTLLLVPSLHCNTLLHFTTLVPLIKRRIWFDGFGGQGVEAGSNRMQQKIL